MKKSFLFISGKRLDSLIAEKVANLEDFADSIGYTRQYLAKIRGKDRVKMPAGKVELVKNYLNVPYDDFKYTPERSQNVSNSESVEEHPLYIAIRRELEEVRTSRNDWRELAKDYKQKLEKLRGEKE